MSIKERETEMNIKQAKNEIENTVRAYLLRDENGAPVIPVERQRPIFLIGAPGIGKTAIMQEIAEEMKINLVAYTITHHTRQSAIGLPFISKRNYGGTEYSVTEYTMSEILASVYDQINRSGIQEGILFLDEINCVSETLAPTMLQFLQYKTFGTHRVPDGFVIVTAGNPPEYNKSVRDFDIATLDRVKRIYVEPDAEVWREYAYRAGIHGSILSYLEIHPENFYSVKAEVEGSEFVTARGWEDLSRMIGAYEELKFPVTEDLVSQYLGNEAVSRDFADYYELYNRYRNVYKIPEILAGNFPEGKEQLLSAPFDERLSLIGLLLDALSTVFRAFQEAHEEEQSVFEEMKLLKAAGADPLEKRALPEVLRADLSVRHEEFLKKRRAGLLSQDEECAFLNSEKALRRLLSENIFEGGNRQEDFERARAWFSARETERKAEAQASGEHLTNAFRFISETFGDGTELVLFLTELSRGYYSLKFISSVGNEEYFRLSRLLLLKDRKEELRQEIMENFSV